MNFLQMIELQDYISHPEQPREGDGQDWSRR